MLPAAHLNDLRKACPLIHCIANLVAANDCANVLLAAGASPMMAQAAEEMEQISHLSAATVLNTGTPDREKFAVCRLSGQFACKNQPVVLDPVGVGASAWRLEETESLLQRVSPTILRVNLGEANALLHRASGERGVDFTAAAGLPERIAAAKALAEQVHAAVLLTGEQDVASDGVRLCVISGGSRWMARVTGTGCMLSALCGAFAAVESEGFLAAALASSFWKTCGALAEQSLRPGEGAGTFRVRLLDAASLLTAADWAAQMQTKFCE